MKAINQKEVRVAKLFQNQNNDVKIRKNMKFLASVFLPLYRAPLWSL